MWAVGAVAVTIPSCYYILTTIDTGGHGHDEHGEGHGEEHGEEHEEEGEGKGEEEKSDSSDQKAQEKSDDSDDSESGDEKEADTPETSDDEGGDGSESQDEGQNTKKHIPDAKGGAKKRVESNNSQNLGDKPESDHDGSPDDQASPSKSPGGKNTQSGKQEGLTNTDTKHSTDAPGASEKADGQPETAKSKGTVDSKRPAA